MRASRRFPGSLVGAPVLLVLLLAGPAAAGCGSDGGSGPGLGCNDASFDLQGNVSFSLSCNSVHVTTSGITYDQFGRVVAYDFEFSCSDGSDRVTGRVYNITHNGFGEVTGLDYSVGGRNCGHVNYT